MIQMKNEWNKETNKSFRNEGLFRNFADKNFTGLVFNPFQFAFNVNDFILLTEKHQFTYFHSQFQSPFHYHCVVGRIQFHVNVDANEINDAYAYIWHINDFL